MTDYHLRVPRELAANLRYRKRVRERAAKDEEFRRSVMAACKADVLFFFSVFIWVYEPRQRFNSAGRPLPSKIPFIPWDHQIPVIKELRRVLGTEDAGIEKARGEGMSWIGVLLALHDWLFRPDTTVGMCSSTESKADKVNDRGSLMGKLDWELEQLPAWMVGTKGKDYTRSITDHSLVNHRINSLIVAHSATAGTGRGHRYYWFFLDELSEWIPPKDADVMSSLQQATESRLVAATPWGIDGAYYRFMNTPSNAVKLVLDWRDNPSRNRGLYKFVNDVPVAVDPINNPLPREYSPPNTKTLAMFTRLRERGYNLTSEKARSPWYDRECDRAEATPLSIARELDRDYGGSRARAFGDTFQEIAKKKVIAPLHQGNWKFDPETLRGYFDEVANGPMFLWTPLSMDRKPAKRPYAMGADIALGTGGSYSNNSAVEIVDLVTMEQVLEFATNTMSPERFADLCVSLARWFHDAFFCWEHMGPGHQFTTRMLELAYQRIYRRTVDESSTSGRSKKTKKVGWSGVNPHVRGAMFTSLSTTVESGGLILHSRALVEETSQYVIEDGKIVHAGSQRSEDGADKGLAHGDRVVAMGMALIAAKDIESGRPTKVEGEMPEHDRPDTLAARERYHAALAVEADDWDTRDNADLARGRR